MQTEKVIQHIVKELNAYCDNAGLKGFVVGVSGGIDSAVTSTLSAKTGRKTIALNMPILQAKSQDSLSSRHIAWLEKDYPNVQGVRVDLSEVFLTLGKTLPIRHSGCALHGQYAITAAHADAVCLCNPPPVFGGGHRKQG